MKQTELRLGNLIEYREKRIVTVVSLGVLQTEDNLGLMYGSDDIEDYNPIPLTEEWLEKLGFEQIYDSKMHSTYYLMGLSYYFWYDKIRQYAQYYSVIVNCQSVHQLQNLYFALTNEELCLQSEQK